MEDETVLSFAQMRFGKFKDGMTASNWPEFSRSLSRVFQCYDAFDMVRGLEHEPEKEADESSFELGESGL